MHALYSACGSAGLPWEERTAEEYYENCRRCEIRVTLTTAAERDLLVSKFIWMPAAQKGKLKGRLIQYAATEFPTLQVGDRLEPSFFINGCGEVGSCPDTVDSDVLAAASLRNLCR